IEAAKEHRGSTERRHSSASTYRRPGDLPLHPRDPVPFPRVAEVRGPIVPTEENHPRRAAAAAARARRGEARHADSARHAHRALRTARTVVQAVVARRARAASCALRRIAGAGAAGALLPSATPAGGADGAAPIRVAARLVGAAWRARAGAADV